MISDGYIRLDMWPSIVVFQFEIFKMEVENVLYIRIQFHRGERARSSRELQARLFQMVEIEMRVARSVNEVASAESAYLRHHLQEKCIRSNVERHSQERVGRTLIELERQAAISHVELKEHVAGR